MLRMIKTSDPYEKWDLAKRFQPETDGLVVSDIKTKTAWEWELLGLRSFLPGLCVLRADEFYKELFVRLNTEWNLADDRFVKACLADFCRRDKDPYIQNLKNSAGFFALFKTFLAVFMHPEGDALLDEWLKGQKISPSRKALCFAGRRFFHLLEKKKILPESGTKAFLLNSAPLFGPIPFPKKRLFVDLDFSIDPNEKDIFKELARGMEICILSPEIKPNPYFDSHFDIYKEWERELPANRISFLDTGATRADQSKLFAESYITQTEMTDQNRFSAETNVEQSKPSAEKHIAQKEMTDQSKASLETNRDQKTGATRADPAGSLGKSFPQAGDRPFSKEQTGLLDNAKDFNRPGAIFKIQSDTQIEELEKAVAQTLKWKESGVPLKDIAICAPNIESCWFALKNFLDRQNVPADKSLFVRANDFPAVGYFVSALRAHLGLMGFSDWERFCFYKPSSKDFARFQEDYFRVPGRIRSKELLIAGQMISKNKALKGQEFIEWALAFWPMDGSDFLWSAVSRVFIKFPKGESLSAAEWLFWLESELSALNLNLKGEAVEGVSCLSWNAVSSLKSPYVFITGLSEESFSQFAASPFEKSEEEDLLSALGFPLPVKDPKEKEKQLLWLLQSSQIKELVLSFASYDFKGNIQTESLIYSLCDMLCGAKLKEIGLARQIKPQGLKPSAFFAAKGIADKTALDLDKALQNKQKAFFMPEGQLSLSPQVLKTYAECPFRYAADKLFFAKARPESDRELSPLSKGGAVHRLFESALSQEAPPLPDNQKDEIIESALQSEREVICEEQMEVMTEELKFYLLKFLEKERENQSLQDYFKPLALESEFEGFWDPETGLSTKGKYPFKARIDRIDKGVSADVYIVRDYKSSSAGLNHISSWIKEGKEDLQLTFYAQAVQKGLIKDLPAGEVLALFYSCYKENFSAKGFEEKDSLAKGIMGQNLRSNKQKSEILFQAIEQSHKKTKELVRLMEQGQFAPKPKDQKICKTCSYQTWCRVDVL